MRTRPTANTPTPSASSEARASRPRVRRHHPRTLRRHPPRRRRPTDAEAGQIPREPGPRAIPRPSDIAVRPYQEQAVSVRLLDLSPDDPHRLRHPGRPHPHRHQRPVRPPERVEEPYAVPRCTLVDRPSTSAAIGRRSSSYESNSPAPAPSRSTAPSFQPRLYASCTLVFRPWPPAGECTWAASPARKTRPERKRSAKAARGRKSDAQRTMVTSSGARCAAKATTSRNAPA